MKSIFITGSSGFVGKNIIKYFNTKYEIYMFSKNEEINIKQDIVLHFAGKAHDLKNIANAEEYYAVNTELTKVVFDNFLQSNAKVFITLSSVKAVADELNSELTENHIPHPITHYGNSKLNAEKYILSKKIPKGKRVYILRPCMIHGPDNKGNLNLLYKLVSKELTWPLGAFYNKRSFCSLENLIFVIKELIERKDILSGIYNIADTEPLSTNELIILIAQFQNKKPKIIRLPKFIVFFFIKIGDFFHLKFNTENLKKLTQTYIVSNKKLLTAIGKPLPINVKDGLLKTFRSF